MNGKIFEQAFHYNGLHIDIFYYWEKSDDIIWCYFSEIGLNMSFENHTEFQIAKGYRTSTVESHFNGLMDYEFKGETFKIPTNYDEYLIDNYGPTYMRIDESWVAGESPENIKLVDTPVIVKEYI
jgi:hypothetical protein